jgi:hypothetical protein
VVLAAVIGLAVSGSLDLPGNANVNGLIGFGATLGVLYVLYIREPADGG